MAASNRSDSEFPDEPGARTAVLADGRAFRNVRDVCDLTLEDDGARLSPLGGSEGVQIPYRRLDGGDVGLLIGRDPSCDLVISSPLVSARHAELRLTAERTLLVDLGSTNDTFVNKIRLRSGEAWPVWESFRVVIGSRQLVLHGSRVTRPTDRPRLPLAAMDLHAGSGQRLWLREASLAIRPGELVVVKGFTGSSKSVLLELLAGRVRPLRGQTTLAGMELHRHARRLRPLIGYVPDERALLPLLTVQQWLRSVGRLRVAGLRRKAVRARIDDVLTRLELSSVRRQRLATLSLGQRKRLLLGAELLVDPPVLFVDEVTSNVDVGTEERVLRVLREKVSFGHVVVAITHHDVNLEDTDQVVFMCRGRMVFAGTPGELLPFFGARDSRDLNETLDADKDEALAERTAETWARTFSESPLALRHQQRLDEVRALTPAGLEVLRPYRKRARPGFLRQTWGALHRNALSFSKDLASVFFGLCFGPLVALLVALVLPTRVDLVQAVQKLEISKETKRIALSNPRRLPKLTPKEAVKVKDQLTEGPAFKEERSRFLYRRAVQGVLVLTLVLAGILVGAVQIVKEQAMALHERLAGVRRTSYLFAKVLWLGVVGALMAGGLAATAHHVTYLGEPLWQVALVLYATALASLALGLAVSAWTGSTEAALFVGLLLVACQIVFSGLIPALGEASLKAGAFVPAAWGARGLAATLDDLTRMLYLALGDVRFDETPPLRSAAMNGAIALGCVMVAWMGLWWRERRGATR